MNSATLELTKALITRASVTPDDRGCQDLLAKRLERIGFSIERMNAHGVSNLYARRGTHAPLVCLAGHTDVVPPGPPERWSHDPFTPTECDGQLYGRGAADMKSGVAAMVTAVEDFIAAHPNHCGSLAFLITSDEEGPAKYGTRLVMEQLTARGEHIDYALVGEPSSLNTLGDTIKVGRRGSLSGDLTVHGKQGHVAYPERAYNPFHACVEALTQLCDEHWDEGNAHFPPTSFQLTNLNMGTGTDNVVPGELRAQFNLRFSTEITPEEIERRTRVILDAGGFAYDLGWRLSAKPFLTASGRLIEAARTAIQAVCGIETTATTTGGTSDGRFIAPTGAEVIELGPINATIHQANEHVAIADLDRLSLIYRHLLANLLAQT